VSRNGSGEPSGAWQIPRSGWHPQKESFNKLVYSSRSGVGIGEIPKNLPAVVEEILSAKSRQPWIETARLDRGRTSGRPAHRFEPREY
jgi:hypothetical protein